MVSELLKQDRGTELAKKLEILRLFLESADFNKPRSESEKHLVEGERVKFVVCLEKGKPKYEMRIVQTMGRILLETSPLLSFKE